MNEIISTSGVNVKTLQVNIKALIVGKKQVTISMFNQFLREEIIGTDGNLKGIPWGFIKHNAGKYIVWQKDNEIKINNPVRDGVESPCMEDYCFEREMAKEAINRNVKCHTIIQTLNHNQDFIEPKHAVYVYGLQPLVVKNDRWNVTLEPKDIRSIAEYWYTESDEKIKKDDSSIWIPKKETPEEIKEGLLKEYVPDESFEECKNMQNQVDEYLKNFNKSMEILNNLEQLFIAV